MECIDCGIEKKCKSGLRCKSCSNSIKGKKLWEQSNYREHMSLVHKGQIPGSLEQLRKHAKSKANLIHLQKINEAKKGKNFIEMYGLEKANRIKQVISTTHKGKEVSLEMRKQISKSLLGNPLISGENNWNWKGGITPVNKRIRASFDYEEWRTKVFERDLYICQICFQAGGYLQADHKKPFSLYPDLRLDINNGQTLCFDCHKIKTKNDWKLYKFYERRTK